MKKLLLDLSLFCLNCVLLKGLNFCSSGWLQSPTSYSCFKFYHEKKSWGDARSTCQAFNGDLIINLDDKKQNLIAAQRKRHTDEEFWNSLNDRKNEDHFKWLDGTQMISKTYWDDDQPNDEHDNEDSIVLRNAKSNIAKWNDLTCSKHRKFICEFFPDCPGNTFGGRCTDICNLTCGGANNTCKRFDGFCINGCDIGYQGNTCDAPCPVGTFGDKCAKTCNKNCYGSQNACNSVTGACSLGCDDGYQGERCETSCPGNFYGPGCSLKCSVHCNGWNNKCDYTGKCYFGCNDGYIGEKCDEGCDNGTYGANCLEKCSAYCGGLDRECDSRTGKCVSGCAIGFKGDKCDTECDKNKYGANCSQDCSPNCAGPSKECNSTTGECLSGCDDGYEGDKCEYVAVTLGRRPRKNPSDACTPFCGGETKFCDNKTGPCAFHCVPGQHGEMCYIECIATEYKANCSENGSKERQGSQAYVIHELL
ncbi:hypothetical protein RRG08_000382 [Elysia crispata]|uniref:C-type lectin domain-containing protein n=1 Tax=Elysia crispata TaxID=231223 RepID=A0AAE0Z4T6_9GAST|nr:hypothetical protein RRG08_000382 [Elysia crispata]